MGNGQEHARHGAQKSLGTALLLLNSIVKGLFYHPVFSFTLTKHRKSLKTCNRLSSFPSVAPLSKDERPSACSPPVRTIPFTVFALGNNSKCIVLNAVWPYHSNINGGGGCIRGSAVG